MTGTVLFNGEYLPATDAKVGIYDGGWLHGAGLFETMRAENGRVFRYETHIDRLRRSAEQILRPIARADLPSRVDCLELLDRNDLRAARVRLTVTAGSMLADAEETAPPLSICTTAAPLGPPPSTAYETGVQVAVCRFKQSTSDPVAGHKTTAYLPRLLGLREAQRAGCMEAIWFTTANALAEGSISNVFLVKNDTIMTPPLDTPVLPGIARAVVLDLAAQMGIDAKACNLSIDALLDADEVFLTNAIMQVMPVARVERKDIGHGGVGPLSRKLLEAYRDTVKKECRLT